MITALAFAVVAGLGAAVRYVVRVGSARWAHLPLPIGTLAVNLAGSFALGLLAGWDPPGATVVGVGGLGALTTFSTFAGEVVSTRHHRFALASYVVVSVVGGVGLAWLGLQLA